MLASNYFPQVAHAALLAVVLMTTTVCIHEALAQGSPVVTDADIERAVLRLDGFDCHDLAVTNLQYMRDPHANYSHGIFTVAGIMKEHA